MGTLLKQTGGSLWDDLQKPCLRIVGMPRSVFQQVDVGSVKTNTGIESDRGISESRSRIVHDVSDPRTMRGRTQFSFGSGVNRDTWNGSIQRQDEHDTYRTKDTKQVKPWLSMSMFFARPVFGNTRP